VVRGSWFVVRGSWFVVRGLTNYLFRNWILTFAFKLSPYFFYIFSLGIEPLQGSGCRNLFFSPDCIRGYKYWMPTASVWHINTFDFGLWTLDFRLIKAFTFLLWELNLFRVHDKGSHLPPDFNRGYKCWMPIASV